MLNRKIIANFHDTSHIQDHQQKEKKETVFLLHGLLGNERILDLVQELRRNRGAWVGQGEFLFSNCLEDVKKVMHFFSTSKNSDKCKIKTDSFILFGNSMGGAIALLSGGAD